MEGKGGDVEMNAIKNDSLSVSDGDGDSAAGEVLPDYSGLHGRRMTNGFSPPPVGNRPARGSSEFPFMPTRYDRPLSVTVYQGYNVPEVERVRREAEKKRIRDDIIAAGVAWRRSVESEVLRDLQVEGLGFPGFEHSRVPETNEEKLIALAKLHPGHLGVNRKDEDLLEVPSLPCPGVKKPKKELSCSLCNESSIGEKDLNSHLEGSKHQAKVAAVKAELAAKCCGTPLVRSKPTNLATTVGSDDIEVAPPANGLKRKAETLSEEPSLPSPCGSTPPMANKPANPSKLSFAAAGSERNGDVKGTPTASGGSAPDAKVEVGEEVGSKTEESASQDCKSLLSEKKYKNWYEVWKDCALAPNVIKEANQNSQSDEIVADLPIRRLSVNDEKEDATEKVHDVLQNRKVELAFPKAITAEAFANLAQIRLTSNGKKDDIAIEKADGSTVCDAKTEAVQDVQEHEKAEGAALDAMAAEAARRENVGKLFKKMNQN